jgi:methylmalonyl-CoA mutase
MAIEPLLEEFPRVSTATWEAAIASDLKGADYEKKLIWRTGEGLSVKPYYRAEDLKGIACLNAAPGNFPYRRSAHATGDWRIREEIDATDPVEANAAACSAVAAGSEEIAFSGVSVHNDADLEALLANLSEIPVHFDRCDPKLIAMLLRRFNNGGKSAEISTGCDALSDTDLAAETIQSSPAGFVPFSVHAESYADAGATAIEEIGFALAAGVDFLAAMDERGVSVNKASAAVEFRFAIGGNFFFEIAKLRAFRTAWARIVERFGGTEEAARARIAAHTSQWNKTVYDPHVNILRATTEAMAAVLGGADSITVAPFDSCYKQPDDASRRLARNTQLLLKHEAGLGRVADAGGGSYYLEAITDQLAREAWKTMQELEARGGYRKALAERAIAKLLERSLAARDEAVARRRSVIIGTNQFANPSESAIDRVDMNRLREAPRGALAFEELRLRTERHAAAGGKTPRVLLAEFGDVKMRGARSNFAANFFACAGFDIVTRRFKKAEDIAAAESDLIVLCSADQEYAALAADLMQHLKALALATPVVVAGNPENAEELRRIGVADFVHVRSNALEALTIWQQRLGIEG